MLIEITFGWFKSNRIEIKKAFRKLEKIKKKNFFKKKIEMKYPINSNEIFLGWEKNTKMKMAG